MVKSNQQEHFTPEQIYIRVQLELITEINMDLNIILEEYV